MGYYTVYSDELYHHGVLGMKWGVRRTPAQLARAAGRKIASGTSKSVRSVQAAHIENRMGKANVKRMKAQKRFEKYDAKYKKLDALRDKKISDLSEGQIKAGRVAYVTSKVIGKIAISTAATAVAGYTAGANAYQAALKVSGLTRADMYFTPSGAVYNSKAAADAYKLVKASRDVAEAKAVAGTLAVSGAAAYATRNKISKSGKKKKD